MTFREIISTLLDLAGQDAGGDYETMVKRAVNRTYRRVLSEIDQDTRRREFSLTTAASTSQYGCPLYVHRILNIEDATNQRSIKEISAREFDRLYPGTTNSGDPRFYYVLGTYGVQAQPSTAATVQASSSSTSDVTNYYLRVQGFNASNVLVTEELTLNGTTAVTSTNTFSKIESLSKRAASGFSWNGNVTVTDGTDTLAVIPVEVTAPQYLWIEFYPIPDSALTLTVRAQMREPDLVNDSDWPDIDEDFHTLLIDGPGVELLAAVGQDALAAKMQGDYQMGFLKLRGATQRRPNRYRVFNDISSGPYWARDDRPLIKGIDYV